MLRRVLSALVLVQLFLRDELGAAHGTAESPSGWNGAR